MANEKILAVDDERDILELLRYNLSKEGYQFTGVESGEEALNQARTTHPDLLILDLMLPGLDGLEVCKKLKANSSTQNIPIVMLSARGEEADIVTGLELGADDYITKPFSPRILLARIKTVLRRKQTQPVDQKTPLNIDNLSIHPGRHQVTLNDSLLDLTLTEFRILHLLAGKRGWVFTRYQIVHAVHGEDYPVTDRSIDVQIVGLRKKLKEFGKKIETVRGVGYRFKE